ncbi:hypothetical protein KKF84_22275, partial [Myxococcota bacterium]|nr:hypothetical protein [Myxococcota bacterium]
DIQCVDAPRLRAKSFVVGKVLPAALAVHDRAKLTEFLLRAQMIQTYYHISATVCAVSAVEQEGSRTTIFKASHLYFTNRKNVDHYGFSITIGRDGTITVAGVR